MDRITRLGDQIEFPKQGILSKTVHETASGEADLFMLPKGEKISSHTSSRDASVLILQGEAEFTLGEETYRVKAGDWFFMEAGLVHALVAIEDLAFLLTLFGSSD
jgi:quercetin dioxygenase-like cupin family protein